MHYVYPQFLIMSEEDEKKKGRRNSIWPTLVKGGVCFFLVFYFSFFEIENQFLGQIFFKSVILLCLMFKVSK